jgi:adenylate kinase family enzyme
VVTDLANVLWIGGVAGAGKTTVARILARHHGMRRYNPDTQTWSHLARALAGGNPAAQRFARMTPSERAAAVPAEIDYHRGPMIIEDLRSLPAAPLVVAELVSPEPAIVPIGQAVALMTSQKAQQTRLERRHPDGVPPRYVRQWQATTDKLMHSGAHAIVVDDLTIDDTVAEVERYFKNRIADGPTAETLEQRRDLLRYANQAVVDQAIGWAQHTRGGDVSTASLSLECECARPTCSALVSLAFADAYSAITQEPPTILAGGHQA